jgi:hypothetical protein
VVGDSPTNVRQVVAIDLTRALVQVGAERLHSAGVGNVLLQEGNAATLPFVDASFDVVLRDRFDELHRALDPSHARALLESELAAAMEAVVGPLSYGATSSIEFTFGSGVPDTVQRALRAELAGGRATGFRPTATDDGRIEVSFVETVVHATRTIA